MTEDLINAAQRVGASREMAEQVVADGPPPAVLEIVIGVARAMGQLDAEAAHKYLTADFVDHEASPGVGTGPEGYLATARYMHQAFPDAAWQPEDFFTAGDKYAVRVTFRGTHQGEFLGIMPTGRRVEVQHLHFYRIADGRVAEHWGARDELTLLRQLGVFTPEHANPADAAAGFKAPA